jgi:hypothetical protein
MEYKIEKGIPIPPAPRTSGKRYGLADHLRRMQVGESVFVAKPTKSVQSSSYLAKKETGFSFVVRSQEQDGVKGARVWRVE